MQTGRIFKPIGHNEMEAPDWYPQHALPPDDPANEPEDTSESFSLEDSDSDLPRDNDPDDPIETMILMIPIPILIHLEFRTLDNQLSCITCVTTPFMPCFIGWTLSA